MTSPGGDLTAEPREVDYVETEAGGRPAMWAVPKRRQAGAVLLCVHGGGFVSGSVYTQRRGAMMAGTLAYQALTTVIQTLVVLGIAVACGPGSAAARPAPGSPWPRPR
jgi:acetyl esterase/lipase